MSEPLNTELGQLAALSFDPASAGGALPEGDPAAPPGEDQTTQALDAAVAALALGLLRTARTIIAARMPEIRDEWTDDVLRAPADAIPPVMKRYAGNVSEWAAKYPELVVLGVSCLPLAMGYMAAVEKHARTVQDVKAKPPAQAPMPPAPMPMPAGPAPDENGVFHVG